MLLNDAYRASPVNLGAATVRTSGAMSANHLLHRNTSVLAYVRKDDREQSGEPCKRLNENV